MKRRERRLSSWVAVGLLVLLIGFVSTLAQPTPPVVRPGPAGEVTLLPNGWKISPAGRHLQVGDLPLNMILSPDGRYLIVTNNGYSNPTFTIVDARTFTVTATVPVDEAWLGLAWHPDGKRFYSSAENAVREFNFLDGAVTPGRTFPLGPTPVKSAFTGGLAVAPDGAHLFVVRVLAQSLISVNLETGTIEKTIDLPAEPYTCATSRDGATVYVSLWGGSKVLAFDARTLNQTGSVPAGDHPNAMVLSPDGATLYVACANTNSVWVLDTRALKGTEQVAVSLYPDSPAGTTPNGLALSPDGTTLFVANADNNTVAVVSLGVRASSTDNARVRAEGVEGRPDESTGDAAPRSASVLGFIPTGWYPTGVLVPADGKQLFVLSGKGLRSRANPAGPNPVKGTKSEYIAQLLPGTVSTVPMPDVTALQSYTSTVYALTPYTAATRFAPGGTASATAIPRRVGDGSPVKYVFYIIRENRTYDQVLGDMKQGNGDPGLCLFGEAVTPNAHAIARNYVLFDNFYVNAEVSYGGHAYSTGAYSTDIVEKMWPVNYANRGGVYLSEGGGNMRGPYGNIAAPSAGYIWDACTRKGISVRSYGEFVERVGAGERMAGQPAAGGRSVRASVPGLEGRINPDFPPFDMNITDQVRVDVWLKEFRQFEAGGDLPRLSIIRLPRDHTSGARAGSISPTSMVADNDLALGRMIEAISRSRFWKESAIFVLEDDAQNGPDHVDAHRSVLLVISPFIRRTTVDSTLYTTCGVLRTMELILGLPPMTQLDAAATPLYNAFQATPDLSPYAAEKARVSLDDRNPPKGPGAAEAAAFNLDEADLVPDIAFSENVWRAVRGAHSPMPPPRRSVFVKEVRGQER